MWVGWAQLTTNPSGASSASTRATASRNGVPSGSRPSVSTVKPTSTGTPAWRAARAIPMPSSGLVIVYAATRSAPAAANASTWPRW